MTALVTRCGWEPRSHHVTGHFSGKTDGGSFWVNPGLKKEPWRQIKERRRSPRKITSLPWSRLLAQEPACGPGGSCAPTSRGTWTCTDVWAHACPTHTLRARGRGGCRGPLRMALLLLRAPRPRQTGLWPNKPSRLGAGPARGAEGTAHAEPPLLGLAGNYLVTLARSRGLFRARTFPGVLGPARPGLAQSDAPAGRGASAWQADAASARFGGWR